MTDYDLAIVGGGLAGSALGLVMARQGKQVLIVENSKLFRDRVRGETMAPWGSEEAQRLGIYDLLRDRCGLEVQYTTFWVAGEPGQPRDLYATTTHGMGNLDFKHPEMQEALINAARNAGAHVQRGCAAKSVTLGRPPVVSISDTDGVREVSAQLVVGADGRESRVRRWAGFVVLREPPYLFAASVLFESSTADLRGSVHYISDPVTPRNTFIVPVARNYFRPYLMYRREVIDRQLSGERDTTTLIDHCVAAGAPREWFADALVAGPLATFEGASRWVEKPYRDGIVLVGDAASSSDPSWGNGLSMTLRDVRMLSERLSASGDWREAASDYADEQATQAYRLRQGETMLRDLLYESGDAALERRYRAMELLESEPDRDPDLFGIGPDAPCDDMARARFLGEA